MAKKITKQIKVVVPAGKATPAGTLGPALGQAGVNIGQFVTEFNARTKDAMGDSLPTLITVYEDRSFTFVTKTPNASRLLLKEAGIEKGSGKVPSVRAGTISKAKVKAIAERKMVDLNANDINAAVRIIEGTARSMGLDIK